MSFFDAPWHVVFVALIIVIIIVIVTIVRLVFSGRRRR